MGGFPSQGRLTCPYLWGRVARLCRVRWGLLLAVPARHFEERRDEKSLRTRFLTSFEMTRGLAYNRTTGDCPPREISFPHTPKEEP